MTVAEMVLVKSKKYKLVAPDGGWGYMICLAAVIHFVATTAFIPCFGLLYNDFLVEIGVGSTGVTLLNGINAISMAVGGYLSSPLLKVLSLRSLALAACISYNCGFLFLVVSNSKLPFFICQGVLQGMGIGMLYNLTFTVINEYFVERRLFALSVIQTLTATFAMFAPQLVTITLNLYGYRGMLLCATAVGLQAFVGVAMLQPVQRHMKKVELPCDNELEALLLKEAQDGTIPTIKLTDVERVPVEEKSQISSNVDDSQEEKKSGIMTVMRELLDFSTMRIFLTTFPAWGCSLTTFADIMFTLMMPQGLYAAGWQEGDVAMAMSLAGFGDLAARGVFIVLSNFLSKIGNQELYIIGLLFSTIAKVGMLLSTNVIVVFMFVTLLGVGRCFLALIMPLVMCDVTGPERFTSAMGMFLVFMGALSMGLGPVVGVIRDSTGSYFITFFVLTAMTAVCMVTWSIQLVHKAKQRRSNVKNKDISK